MSKKNWYKRSHQFTPYTKADGTAVSDEFDAIQASFERIPEMRDDGKGFAVSPLIPKPTDPNHPVTYGMLTESENSVNVARDDVTAKARQVAQNTQTVAANTQTAINQANSATQSATSAAASSRSADESEDWARKWASNPADQIVAGDKYSAYHYAMKASKSEQNLSVAEQSARNNANIATQKAEEAKASAKKAESLAVGEVEYGKILHVPRADTSTEGIVRLTDDAGLDSDKLGLTARAGKLLSQAINTVRLALNNYIPNSKKSSAVNSDSTDTVANSVAVKKAYDKGVEAKTSADKAQQTADKALPLKNATSQQIEVGDYRFSLQTDGNLVMTKISSNEIVYAASRWVSKLGDKMAGQLSNQHHGIGGYHNQFDTGAPFFVDSIGYRKESTFHPIVKGKIRDRGDYGVAFSFGYTTKQPGYYENGEFGRGVINLNQDNGVYKNWEFEHNGTFRSAGDVVTSSGKSLNTAAQLSDFAYQKIGNFEIRRYPDGTMIQTYHLVVQDNQVGKKLEFNWSQSFSSIPDVMFSPVFKEAITLGAQNDYTPSTLMLNTIDYLSSGSKCVFFIREIEGHNQTNVTVKFLAIGRWK